MAKFLMLLYRLVNLYLYFVVMACFLAIVPNINPAYPLFNTIFKFAGFYIIPPVFGVSFSPMLMLVVLTLMNMGIYRIYQKKFADKEPKIIVMSADEFKKKIEMNNKLNNDKKISSEERKDENK